MPSSTVCVDASLHGAHYLALAEALGADLWTADLRLVKTVGEILPWVHRLA